MDPVTLGAAMGYTDAHANRTDNPHGVTKEQVGLGNVDNVKQATKAEFDAHVSNKDNPHGVTKSQVGLGNVQNYGIATEAEAKAGTVNNKYMTPQRTKQAIDEHANRTDNPHGVTKEQVGLGNVQNFGIATQAEAEAGTSNSKYMTPQRTRQAINKVLGDEDYLKRAGGTMEGDLNMQNHGIVLGNFRIMYNSATESLDFVLAT